MHPFFHGLLFGLWFLVFIGPAFFALLQTSVQRGLKPAIFLAFGVSTSDIILVLLMLLGLSSWLERPAFKFWIGVFGAITLIVYGIYTWMKPPPKIKELEEENGKYLIKYWIKGLVLNGLNPLLILFWVSWVSFASVNYDYSGRQQYQFFAGLLLTILTTDVLKATFANRYKHNINPKWFRRVNKIVAIILVGFGLRIVYYLVQNY
ncbi:MAG: LysE family transporter [Bacteroidota bacterium]